MITKPPGRKYYLVKFQYKGKPIRKRTRATDAKTARAIEAKLRSDLAKGDWGILEAKPTLTLAEFLRKDFLPFTRAHFVGKPKTLAYYEYGTGRLVKSDLSALKLEEITGQHSTQLAARLSHLSASTINCVVRTLRRALALAVEWGKLNRMPKIALAKGERQRDRVLAEAEIELYLEHCRQPWRDAALLLVWTGMRPGEVYGLRWENVTLNGDLGLIHVAEGKSRAARRSVPAVAQVARMLRRRLEEQGGVQEGWVFPSGSVCGHLEQGTAKTQHAAALRAANAELKRQNLPALKPFVPYTMRHTALTKLAAFCDPFMLAKVAGHSSITITQRYCHPQADAIQAAFTKFGTSQEVVTEAGHRQNSLSLVSENQRRLSA